jgi:hypothetical protein
MIMKKLFTGNGNPPKDKPKREPIPPVETGDEVPMQQDTGNGNPPPDQP